MMNIPSNAQNTTSNGTGEDITEEISVDKETVKLFSIEELVPSSTPLTIPYLEIYRTNELEYVPYMSPYNVGVTSDSSDSEDSTESEDESTDESTESTDSESTESSS